MSKWLAVALGLLFKWSHGIAEFGRGDARLFPRSTAHPCNWANGPGPDTRRIRASDLTFANCKDAVSAEQSGIRHDQIPNPWLT